MSAATEKFGKDINTLFTVIYATLRGEKVPHSEVVEKVKTMYPIVLPALVAIPEHNEIVKAVVARYESEVGIKTFDPDFIDATEDKNFWLYKVKDNMPHPYFDRYKLYLSNDGFEPKVIDNIERTCEQILARCANPKTPIGQEKKKGLVVGDVQSGKTANYLGLINMAFDYGYRIVVLLAGTTNSLREQTQKRTDSGVIGAKSDTIGNDIEFVGVGLNTGEHFAVPFTNQIHDFKRFMQKNHNVAIADINKPVVLVVKKIKSILESVSDRIQSELKDKGLDCKSILIIDDEADYASVTTAADPTKPTVINRCIRDIFNKFPISTYVGYTATPFANIFIDPFDDDTYMDLFPSDFIAQLHAPSTYFGGRVVFPTNAKKSRYLRIIREQEPNFLPLIHDKEVAYPALAGSLIEAINSFLICNVIRTLRGQKTKHRSMMINITRFNNTQGKVWERVTEYIEKLTNAIEQLSDLSVEAFCKNQYCNNLYVLFTRHQFFKPIREGSTEESNGVITWEQIQAGLYDEIKKVLVVVINSRNGQMNNFDPSGKKKRFDYDDKKDEGARVIAIGGMVLSRGLTLEGLMTSYYSRNAGAYDTLLQMCRWFGYRPKYKDLCRIYLSQDSIDQFDAVLTATEDLKKQFNEMRLRGKTPSEFGLMVKECPDTLETSLLITSRNKMRHTYVFTRALNYSGVYADTSKLTALSAHNKHNICSFSQLYNKVDFQWVKNDKNPKGHKYYMAQDVSQHLIAHLFRGLNVPMENKKFNLMGVADYTEESEEYPYWDVVIASGSGESKKVIDQMEYLSETSPVERRFTIGTSSFNPYPLIKIGGSNNRVLDPGLLNAGLWYKEGETLSAKEYLQHRKKPILIVFPIDLNFEGQSEDGQDPDVEEKIKSEKIRIKNALEGYPLLAFAYAFPGTGNKVMINYRANEVMIDQLTRGIEMNDDGEGEDTDD